MKIKIKGNIYEITANVPFGLMMDLQENPNDTKVTVKVINEILIPHPTEEKIRQFDMGDIQRIMVLFDKQLKESFAKAKKKL